MDSLVFDPKDKIPMSPPFSAYIVFIACLAMLFILCRRSNISINGLHDNLQSFVFYIVNKMQNGVLSWFRPTINGDTIHVTSYSYGIPRYII